MPDMDVVVFSLLFRVMIEAPCFYFERQPYHEASLRKTTKSVITSITVLRLELVKFVRVVGTPHSVGALFTRRNASIVGLVCLAPGRQTTVPIAS